MEPIVSSETSASNTQTPGNYPKESELRLQHGENSNLKSRILLIYQHYVILMCTVLTLCTVCTTTRVRLLWPILLLYVLKKFWCQLPADGVIILLKHEGAM
jgi:hypothetical protein